MNAPHPRPAATPELATLLALKDGERYLGISLHNGQPCHLVRLPGLFDDANHKTQAERAAAAGGELPNRHDALVLFDDAETRAELDGEWIWTSESVAGNDDYAWVQSFNYGHQNDYRKDYQNRAVAVRRVAI